MDDGYYRSRMEDVKHEREFINREAWKYVSNEYKQPFYKMIFKKLFTRKWTIGKGKRPKNRLESQAKGKTKNYGKQNV